MENVMARKRVNTSRLVKIGMLSAVSIVLMMFELTIPIFPSFLKMDISDLPALVGAVAMGPTAGLLIELIKNILHLFKTSTAGVGEVANFLVGIALVLPIGIMFKKDSTLRGFVIGSAIGLALMVATACLFNYFVLIPAFAAAFGMPISAFVEIANKINASIVDLRTLVLFAIGPFNAIKAVVVAVIGYPLCKMLKKVL